jgi:hypothetical protein
MLLDRNHLFAIYVSLCNHMLSTIFFFPNYGLFKGQVDSATYSFPFIQHTTKFKITFTRTTFHSKHEAKIAKQPYIYCRYSVKNSKASIHFLKTPSQEHQITTTTQMASTSTQNTPRGSASPITSLKNALEVVVRKQKEQNGSLKTVWDAFCHITPNQAASRDAQKEIANRVAAAN